MLTGESCWLIKKSDAKFANIPSVKIAAIVSFVTMRKYSSNIGEFILSFQIFCWIVKRCIGNIQQFRVTMWLDF